MSKLTAYYTAFVFVALGLASITFKAGFDMARVLTEDTREVMTAKRAVDHTFGTSVQVEFPGGHGVYYRWCDPEGFLMYSQGFEASSPLLAIRDERCKGVR